MDISVVIPTYNRANTIERAVNSVLNQTYKPLEIIIVDDGSTDNTRKVIESIKHPLVKYLYKENGGAASARNYGVQNACGNWVAFQDSDDLWREEKLKKQVEYFERHLEYELIYCPYEMHYSSGLVKTIPNTKNRQVLEGKVLQYLIIVNTIGAPTMLINKNAFQDIGGFDEKLRVVEDWNFAVRFAEKHSVGYVDEILVDAYQIDEGVSSNMDATFEERCKMISKYRQVLYKHGLFDTAVNLLFNQAIEFNCLEKVKSIFLSYLSGNN